MGFPWKQLADLTDSEIADILDNRSTKDEFDAQPMQSADAAGGAATGTTGDVNILRTAKNLFEWSVLGTQTITYLSYDANGLEVAQDQTANDGIELTQGINARSKAAYVVGTDKFYVQARIKLADVSGTDDCAFGLRKAEAYQAAIDDYDEMAVLNVISGDVYIETILNGAATSSTDTASSASEASASSEQQTAAIEELAASAAQLSSTADILRETMARFKL